MARMGRQGLLIMFLSFQAVHIKAWTTAGVHKIYHPSPIKAHTQAEVISPPTPQPPFPRVSILDLEYVEAWFESRQLNKIHFKSLYHHLFRNGGTLTPTALNELAGFPRKDATELCHHFVPCVSRVVETHESMGGCKLVVELASGRQVETVLIRHNTHSSGHHRATVCVSSQVGCGRSCSFCATGTMGLLAQLSPAEILEQVWHVRQLLLLDSQREEAGRVKEEDADRGEGGGVDAGARPHPPPLEVRNVVFMGMGEPLDNLDSVITALKGMTHQSLFSLSGKKLTVSTVGASAEKIRRLAVEAPSGVHLALSLHAASQDLRESLLPSARGCGLDKVGAALDFHASMTGSGAMLEYLLIDGLNDRDQDADDLAQFYRDRSAAFVATLPAEKSGHKKKLRAGQPMINIIPYNPTSAGALQGYRTPSDARIAAFHERLRQVHGVNALIRWTSANGRDATGACGQLVTK